jgi:hypothetical protein
VTLLGGYHRPVTVWRQVEGNPHPRQLTRNHYRVEMLVDAAVSLPANAVDPHSRDVSEICPALWNPKYDIHVKNFVPAIMHLCFLGVTQTAGFLIKETLNNFGKYSKFREHDMLKSMRRFSLSWCRIWTYGSNATPYGPWTAENYLGYSRIFKSVYSICLRLLTHDRSVTDERQNIAVLINRLASATNAMLARIMQYSISTSLIEDVDRHIKIFLSAINDLDDANNRCSSKKNTTGKRKKKIRERKRKINSTSNLTSLLNIPSFMHEYGPPRLYWEGGYKGEGVLRSVKPVVTQGTHMSWFATSALQKYYNIKSITMLLRNDNGDENNLTSTVTATIDRKMYTYKLGVSQLTEDIRQGRAISAACRNSDGNVYCLGIHMKQKRLIRLFFNDDLGTILGNTYHAPVEVDTDNLQDVTTFDRFTYIMLLPNRDCAPNCPSHAYMYSCVTEHWKERWRDESGQFIFSLPRVCEAAYGE